MGDRLRSFAQHWPKLETLQLERCEIELDESDELLDDGLLTGLSELKAVSIQHGIKPDTFLHLIRRLPDSVYNLSVGVLGLYDPELAELIELILGPRAAKLSQFGLLDPWAECPASARGVLDDLVGALVGVTKLTISPNALSNLAAVLGPLARLEHVVLALRDTDYWAIETAEEVVREGPEFPAREVVQMMGSVPQLRRVEIMSNTQAGWPAKERKAVSRAASRHGVELEWVTWKTADEWPYIYPPI